MSGIPWPVRYWKDRLDAGHYLLPYQRLAVAHAYEAGGCPSCGTVSRSTKKEEA